MDYPISYIMDLTVRLAHHSTAIEGNTLTQAETKSILIDNYIPRNMSEREFYEVKNYRSYMNYLMDSYKHDVDIEHIKGTHYYIMDNLIDNNGQFKVIPNMIIAASFETTKPYLVPSELKNTLDNTYYRFEIAQNDEDKVKAIIDFHHDFERIHPFSDGNGRTGRALIVHMCMQQDITPIVITKEIKSEYINALNTSNRKAFYDIAFALQNKEKEIMKGFVDMELEKKKHRITFNSGLNYIKDNSQEIS